MGILHVQHRLPPCVSGTYCEYQIAVYKPINIYQAFPKYLFGKNAAIGYLRTKKGYTGLVDYERVASKVQRNMDLQCSTKVRSNTHASEFYSKLLNPSP